MIDEWRPVDARCVGCGNIVTQTAPLEVPAVNTCRVYLNPEAKWNAGSCPMATMIKKKAEQEVKSLDPIKLSKMKMKGK